MGRGSPTAAPGPAGRQRDSRHGARAEGAARKTLEHFFLCVIFFFSKPRYFQPSSSQRGLALRRDTAPLCPPCLQHKVMRGETARHRLVPMEYRRTGQGSSESKRLGLGLGTGDPQDPPVAPPAQAPSPLPASASPTPASAPEKSKPAVRKTTATQAERHTEGKKKKAGIQFLNKVCCLSLRLIFNFQGALPAGQ